MKRVLLLAPQPFFEERGTPIAVRLLLETLAEPGKLEFDLVTYASGADISISGVTQHRIFNLPWTKTIRPGLSVSKLVADLFLLVKAFAIVISKPKGYYAYIHAVEESVFIALALKWFGVAPYLYDMDSSIADQIVEKLPILNCFSPFFRWCERLAIRNATGTIAVCGSLLERARAVGGGWSELLTDVSLLRAVNPRIDLRAELSLPAASKIALYVGNLERYQGVDLLLESWGAIAASHPDWHLVIIGGTADTVRDYSEKALAADLVRVNFAGPRPVDELASYLSFADLLVSPRILGSNTPMKIYSYLHAGKAIIATDLPTHRQVLTDEIALLCDPVKFTVGLSKIIADPNLRNSLAQEALKFADVNCTPEAFERRARSIYARAF